MPGLPFGFAAPCPRCRGRGQLGRAHVKVCPVCEGARVVPTRLLDARTTEVRGNKTVRVYPPLTEAERRQLAGTEG